MKRNKWLALLLALVMVLGMVPLASAEDIAPAAEEAQSTENVAAVQASSWPNAQSDVIEITKFPATLQNGKVYRLSQSYTSTTAGESPITVAAGASASLIINGSVTLRGADASGTTGATAAIKVPSGSTLYIYSAHDEELSTSTAAPKDTLTVYGGNAAAGTDGTNGEKRVVTDESIQQKTTQWVSGDGGNGGGGAAAAIGGNGGSGGSGGLGGFDYQKDQYINEITYGGGYYNMDDHKGTPGNDGATGSAGGSAGKIHILGRLTLNAYGGSAAAGGNGGSGCGGYAQTAGDDKMVGGNGGGGGGGGGCAAPAIGAGGAGGSGGGSGGHAGSDVQGNVQGPGGGGGGGGWPNGGGGGGGGAECSDAEDKNDNSSKGGSGGSGGGVGGTGSGGSSGTTTGTNGHGYNNNRYDAEPGSGGSGASGLNGSGGSYGRGGTEKDDKNYNGGNGGSGGGAVTATAWNTKGSLTLSTANKLNLNSSMGYAYNYGDGQGYGSSKYIIPNIVYDLMDCAVNVNGTYTYTGAQIKPSCTVTYSASSDRDNSRVSHGSSINVTSYTTTYGENIHCPTGTVTLTGKANASRNTATSDGSVVGVRTQEFTIKQAKIKSVSITTDPEASDESPLPFNDYNGQSDSARIILGNYTSTAPNDTNKDIGEIKLATPSGYPNEWQGFFIVSWAEANGYKVTTEYGFPRYYTFISTRGGKFSPQIIMTNMNDFEDFTATIATITVDKSHITADLSPNPPHPRMPVTVTIPEDAGNVTYQWYIGSTKIAGATSNTYTPKNSDIGKNLNVHVIPTDANSPYKNVDDAATGNYVSSHSYSNGFCSVCGEYEKPSGSSTAGYTIKNGGQLFWFAAQVNGDSTHAEDVTEVIRTINGTLANDIDLQNPADTKAGKATEWTPMGSTTGGGTEIPDQYSGTFNGNGHTISGMSITTSDARTGLFADAGTGAVIKNFTIEGNITLTKSNSGTNAGVGGAVGYMYMGEVSDVTSKVTIQNGANDGALTHVGGVVGGTHNAGVTIQRCIFEGSISVYNSHDCIGGVVGYANGKTVIAYCANRGTVKANSLGVGSKAPYVGGILGYINNDTYTAVKNCYNYGSVSCVDNTYCGAVVGLANKIKTLDDCYYLIGSATKGIGQKANYVPMPPAMTKTQFETGEVCYLVNSKTSTGDKALWKQDIDNGNTPYDQYPVFDADSVYYRSDHTYSNYPEKISVTVSWGSMAFTCTQEWDPDTHVNTVTWAPAEDKVSNAFTVKNDSNVKVNVTPTFQAVDAVLSGTVSGLTGSALDKGASETGILSLASTSVPSSLTTSPKKIGSLTITVSALYQS